LAFLGSPSTTSAGPTPRASWPKAWTWRRPRPASGRPTPPHVGDLRPGLRRGRSGGRWPDRARFLASKPPA